MLDGLTGWIEMHIEQARVLQDTGNRIGIVDAIAGYVHADVVVHGRGDHAGATPMDLRLDPTLVLAETASSWSGWRATAGQGNGRDDRGDRGRPRADQRDREQRPVLARHPRAGGRRLSRASHARSPRSRRGARSDAACVPSTRERQTLPATPMDERIVSALEAGAAGTGRAVPADALGSCARHDVRRRPRPTAMVFVPCKDGISHHPAEDAEPADAALAAEIILTAIASLR